MHLHSRACSDTQTARLTFCAPLTRCVATTKASLTPGRMCGRRSPVDARTARASSRKGGFWPCSSAMEEPTMLHCRSACASTEHT